MFYDEVPFTKLQMPILYKQLI